TRVFGRLDLTENRMYTLSQPSKDLVKRLPDYLTVKAFISSDLPPELKMVSRYVRDQLAEYKSSGNGKLRWDAIDPGHQQDLEQEYEVTTVNPSSAEIAKDVDALVVGGPKQAFDDKGRQELDRFLMSGKGAVFLVDGMTMSSPGGGMQGMEQMQIKMAQAN